ncbi:MAG: hypothetical protein MK172_11070 [Verrucomicrobiales bacterium]|nr:hypothetical protein [Verrucomicrobiales bacterium]
MKFLTEEGNKEYASWVGSIEGTDLVKPSNLLEDSLFSCEIPNSPDLPEMSFSTKFELAEVLAPIVEQLYENGLDDDKWEGVWNAMALQYFDSICRRDKDGKWKPNKGKEFYIYDSDFTRFYRHRIKGPVRLYQAGGRALEPFFQVLPHIHGDFEEFVGSSQELVSAQVILVLKALYAKQDDSGIVAGFSTRKNFPSIEKKLPAPGTIRRFVQVFKQLKRTYDLFGIDPDPFMDLLPEEFSRAE